MEKVVHRIWPSGVWRTVPRFRVSSQLNSLQKEMTTGQTGKDKVYSPRILLLAFGSQLACKLREVPAKCTIGSLSPWKLLQSRPSPPVSSDGSLSWAPAGSILVMCHFTRMRRIAVGRKRGQYDLQALRRDMQVFISKVGI
jgi:hypothetical protein